VLFSSYRRGDANDPDGYVASISAVLSRYEPDLIREVTDPNTGIQTTEKFETFMPNVGELKRYLEGIVAHRQNLKRLGPPLPRLERWLPPQRAAGDLANVHVPHTNPRYAGLVKWSETASERLWLRGHNSEGIPGIWVDYGTWTRRSEGTL